MRITFLLPHGGMSGGIRVVAIYAKMLAARGHRVHILWCRKPQVGPLTALMKRLKTGQAPRNTPRKQPWGSEFFDGLDVTQSATARGGRVSASDMPDADVLVATWWETAFAAAEAPARKGRKFYFIQHHEVHEHLARGRSQQSYLLPLKKITISQWLVDLMASEYGDTDVALVENSVDLEQFHAAPRSKKAVPVVGFMYSNKSFKGLEVSLAAIAEARKTVPDLRVLAFGTHPQAPELPEDARYVSKPAQETIRDLYAECDVWLCGSWAEGFHLPPLEAMACRTPVVSTRVGGAVDTVTDGVNGYLADTGDSATLGRRLAEVAALPDAEWQRMSEAAHERAVSYSWQDATDRFEAYLAEEGGSPLRHTG